MFKEAFIGAASLLGLAAASAGIDRLVEGPRKTPAECLAEFNAADAALKPANFDMRGDEYKKLYLNILNNKRACLDRVR